MGLNTTEGMDIFLLCLLCVVQDVQIAASVMSGSLIQRGPSGCVCLCVI